MVGFETGPMAEGRCNDPLPFNFVCIWVTASSKGEGNLHGKSASKCCNYSQCFTVSTASSPCVKRSIDFNYVSYGFHGKWCPNCRGKHDCKNWVAELGNSWLSEQMTVSLERVSFHSRSCVRQWITAVTAHDVAFTSSCTFSVLRWGFRRTKLCRGHLPEKSKQFRWCA